MPTATKARRERVEEAVDRLLSYNGDPFITDYLAKTPIPQGTAQKTLRILLPQALRGELPEYPVELEDLVVYLDELQETGKQHVFLYHLRENRELDHRRLGEDAAWRFRPAEGKVQWPNRRTRRERQP